MPHLPLLPGKDLSKSAQLNENPKKRNAKHHLNIAEDSNELPKLPQLPERSLLNWPKLALTRFICCSAGKSPNEAPTPFKRSQHSQPTSQINCIRSGVEYVYVYQKEGKVGKGQGFLWPTRTGAHTETFAVGVVVATPGVSLAPGAPWLVARKILCVLCARLLQNENCYSTESEAEPEQAAKHSRRVEWQRQRRRRR